MINSSFIKSSFFRSFLYLTSGSFLAQLIIICVSPIMTRLYSPEQIGEYTLVLTSISLFGSIICTRYDMVIVSEKEEINALSLCSLSFFISIIFGFLIFIGYLVYFTCLGYSFKRTFLTCSCIYLLLLLQGLNNILISYNNRKCEYKLMTSVYLIRVIAKESVMVLGGLLHPSTFFLILAEILGTIFGVKRQSKSLIKDSKAYSLFHLDKHLLLQNAKKYRKQPLYSSPALFANSFSYSSINYFVNGLFGIETLGYYSITYRLLALPLNVVGLNISKLYFEEISHKKNQNRRYVDIFFKTSFFLLLISIPMVIVLMLFSPWACSFVFGKDFYVSGLYLRILAPMFALRLIVSPLTVGLIVSDKQKYDLLLQAMLFTSSIICYLATKASSCSIEKYFLMVSVLYSFVYLLFYIILYRFSKQLPSNS